ncbi:MAG TPA: DUF3617 family protein [Acidobacteriaceae bacterium]
MRRTTIALTCICCCLAALAQTRKAGLWELTTTMTYHQSSSPSAPPAPRPHVTNICVTQEELDRYGAIVPRMPGCQVTSVVKKPGGMTGEMVCSGSLSGKATLESAAIEGSDGTRAKGSIHFSGTMGNGASVRPVEWTTSTTSVFKGADCGDIKTSTLPSK